MKAGDLYTAAGALPVSTSEGDNDGTRWVLTQMGTPMGVAVSAIGALYLRRRRPRHGASDRIGSGVPVSRFGRRTFLASSAGVAAGAAAAGAPAPSGSPLGSGSRGRVPVGARRWRGRRRAAPGRGLTVNGLTDPVGIDPDGCYFAWTLRAPGRAVAQAAYRIVVRRTDPTRTGTVWDSGAVVSARQAFVAYGGPGTRRRRRLPVDGAGPRGERQWGPASAPARFTTALRDGDWRAQWLRPAGESSQPDRVTYLRTEVTPPAGRRRPAPPLTCPPPTPTDCS